MAFYRVTAQSLDLRNGPSSGHQGLARLPKHKAQRAMCWRSMTRGIVRNAFKKWSSGVVLALAMCLVLGTRANAQQCSSGPNVCRETALEGRCCTIRTRKETESGRPYVDQIP